MTRTIVSAIIALAAWFGSSAQTTALREDYFVESKPLAAGTFATDTLPAQYTDFDFHLRMEIPRKANFAAWQVNVAYRNGANCRIQIHRAGKALSSSDYGLPLHILVTADSENQSDTLFNARIDNNVRPELDGWSLVMRQSLATDSIICSVGQTHGLVQFAIPPTAVAAISCTATEPLGLCRHSLFATEAPARKSQWIDSEKALRNALAASTNPLEGYWAYLDRDTDPLRLRLGGDYTLASAIAPNGDIELFYLSGAKANAQHWRPLMLKAILKPTPFINHFDLTWFDASGASISTEANADIADGSILRLNFPLQGGSVRFKKVCPSL